MCKLFQIVQKQRWFFFLENGKCDIFNITYLSELEMEADLQD